MRLRCARLLRQQRFRRCGLLAAAIPLGCELLLQLRLLRCGRCRLRLRCARLLRQQRFRRCGLLAAAIPLGCELLLQLRLLRCGRCRLRLRCARLLRQQRFRRCGLLAAALTLGRELLLQLRLLRCGRCRLRLRCARLLRQQRFRRCGLLAAAFTLRCELPLQLRLLRCRGCRLLPKLAFLRFAQLLQLVIKRYLQLDFLLLAGKLLLQSVELVAQLGVLLFPLREPLPRLAPRLLGRLKLQLQLACSLLLRRKPLFRLALRFRLLAQLRFLRSDSRPQTVPLLGLLGRPAFKLLFDLLQLADPPSAALRFLRFGGIAAFEFARPLQRLGKLALQLAAQLQLAGQPLPAFGKLAFECGQTLTKRLQFSPQGCRFRLGALPRSLLLSALRFQFGQPFTLRLQLLLKLRMAPA